MKKLFKSIVAVILSLAFIVSLTACSDDSDAKTITTYSAEAGVHKVSVSETENYLIQNGKSDYKIVVSETASNIVNKAAKKLQNIIYVATGTHLDVITDRNIGYNAEKSTFIFENILYC